MQVTYKRVPEQDNINNISTIIVNDDGSIRKAQHYNIVCKVIDQLLYILIKLPTFPRPPVQD